MRTYTIVLLSVAFLLLSCTMEEAKMINNGGSNGNAIVLTDSELSINEVLFDPIGDGVDYVEIVNVSSSSINLSDYYIRNRNTSGNLSTARQLSKENRILLPGGYCLLTSDYEHLQSQYFCCDDTMHLNISSFPSLPNDAGEVVLTASDDRIVDEFDYSKTMHYPLISNREGISLEKIHPMLSSSMNQYWCSASTDAGYATPGRVNSQYREIIESQTDETNVDLVSFSLERQWVAPGRLDTGSYVCLNYVCSSDALEGQPFVAEVTLCSWDGVPVFSFAQNALLGSAGCYVWNGLNVDGKLLPYGRYVIKIVCFSQDAVIIKKCLPCSVIP